MFAHAITRKPGKNFAQGLTAAIHKIPPDYDLMLQQHQRYVEILRSAGLEVLELDPEPNYPDAYFVEDTAVVTPEVAVITNPGAESRQGEKDSIASVLAPFREIEQIRAPGTLDGGDVLMVGRHFFIGISQRTNPQGAEQLGRILARYGNTWATVPVGAGLHFKSSVNDLGNRTLIVAEALANLEALKDYDKIIVEQDESYAANTLWLNDRLLIPGGFPNTRKKLETLELDIIELDVSEARKMDGGLTCMSIRF